MSIFWNVWIVGLTLTCLGLVLWVLLANKKVAVKDDGNDENRTTGHVYDGIEEYDNPLPLWWFKLFIVSFIAALVYLALYPGLGSYKGLLNWTSVGQLEREQQKGAEKTADIYSEFMATPVKELATNPEAIKMGTRLFANNCAVCHGAAAVGNYSFPNLTDDDWLYGGTPEKIKETLIHGRAGNMPAWGDILGAEKSGHVSHYALSLSGSEHNAELAEKGKPIFAQYCAACHMPSGKGNQLVGAPNLTDDVFLYENTYEDVLQTVLKGRVNKMPAQAPRLKEEKIHILTAYVYSLTLEESE